MSTGQAGVTGQDVQLRVAGAPQGGWRAAHRAGHPELGGGNSYDDDCPFCRAEQRGREYVEATEAAAGARRKADKLHAFHVAALDEVERTEAEERDARDRYEQARDRAGQEGY